VRAWKSSGRTAAEFADGQGFKASTLKWWAYQLARIAKKPKTLVDVAPAVRMVPVVRVQRKERPRPSTVSSGIVLEIGDVRLRVDSGFDRALLREVVAALGGPQ
jgi:hypothetical protein